MLKDDWLMRMMNQLVELIARATSLAREGHGPEATREIEQAYKTFLGMPKHMIDRVDAPTAAMMLRADRGKLLVMLLEAEATVRAQNGDPKGATERRARAAAVKAALTA